MGDLLKILVSRYFVTTIISFTFAGKSGFSHLLCQTKLFGVYTSTDRERFPVHDLGLVRISKSQGFFPFNTHEFQKVYR